MKTFTTLIFSFCSFWLLAQAPVNDDCSGLIDLGEVPFCSDPAQYTNVNATTSVIAVPSENIPACFNNEADRDVWFQFTLPADGSIVDVSISVFGNIFGNGTMQMPQVAIYRGDCTFGGLAELDCAAAPLNVNQVVLEQFGLTPGIPYYLRINDYSATGSPNAGTFRLCVEEYIPDINMGDAPGSESCTGTLWDSGGEDGDYSPSENLTFSICPQDFHQCIILTVQNYATESGFDYLHFYEGEGTTGTQITQIGGNGQDFQVQISGDCATVEFTSDGSVQDEGFQITWVCSPNVCNAPPVTTCADPVSVGTLPYSMSGLNNCFSGNTINGGPCDNDEAFLSGNDYVFSYTSPGDECIHITTSGTNTEAGIGVYDACPTAPNANCITSAGGGFNSSNPIVGAAFLENPGTYYIVFGAGDDCSPFSISVDTITCPVILPPASTCDAALNIGGCSTTLPQVIALTPGSGDPGFIQQGVNQGCILGPQENFSFFYFVAGADGKFGFAVQANNPAEASDIDFNVWGPIDSPEDICDHVTNNQPIRSSWAAGADLTGLADVHPLLGTPVLDEFDCGSPATPGTGANADDFVSRIDVEQGKIYVILLDDFGNAIVNDGISINFDVTTEGVLDAQDNQITITADTAVCNGQPVQLLVTGGAAYSWEPNPTLSCINCPDPIATPNESTTYQVQVATTCSQITKIVDVKIIELSLGPDVTVCNGADFTLNPNPYPEATYTWSGSAGLSCTDCPSPQVAGLTTGTYTFIGVLSTPQCVKTDTVIVNVISGQQPQYNIAEDQIICAGTTVNLGGASVPGTFYIWTSVPAGLEDETSNPSVTPTATTTYYLEAANGSCVVTAIDSVTVTVYQSPVLSVQSDTVICQGQSVVLGTTDVETGIQYEWTPADGLDAPNTANPIATPTQTITYTLVASNPGCTETRTVDIQVSTIDLQVNVEDTLQICQGTSIPIQALSSPTGTPVEWSPLAGLQVGPGGASVTATPNETTLYTATVSVPGCVKTETIYVIVDSLPQNLAILPGDTTICQGSQVILRSTVYEPAEFPNIEFIWTPGNGQLTPDSLFNMVVQPDDTITYLRSTRNGACLSMDSALVNVIQPPQMTVTPATSNLCLGESVLLDLTVPDGVEDIMWTPETGLSCTECNDPTATPTGSTTYTAQGTFQGCPTSVTATVNVKNPPAYQFPSDTDLCGGESITLNLVNDPTATYTWTSTDPAFGTVTTAQPTITPTQNATYTLTATNGCTVTATLSVTVANGVLTTDGDTTICSNFNTPLSASGNLPGTYLWSTGSTQQAIVVAPATTTTYTVIYTFGDECTLTDEIVVNVQGQGAEVTFPTDVQLCPGESVTLNSTVTPGATYSWSGSPGGFTSSDGAPTVSPAVSTTYSVTATLGSCVRTESVSVTVFSGVTLTAPNDLTLCEGESATLTANGSATGTYQWTPGGNTPSITVSPTSNTTYNLLYTYGDGCTLTDAVTVTVVPSFDVRIEPTPDTTRIYVGTPLELMAIVSPTQSLTGFQFQWLENGVPFGTGESFSAEPTTQDSARFSYVVVATSPNGCVASDTFSLTVLPPVVVIPNAFTPGNDDSNNTFGLVILGGNVTVESMDVYNRWGEKVFTSTAPNARWDGRVDGNEAPSDVYVYVIKWRRGDGALEVAHGDVTLLR
ncbi:MAG: gliding motility-associated C-terminal domain-containing protein [Bacteroidetes bacterium]|nr:gliding motility-associated C-terminal domain-containing protein [Bacteroidota bacterium]